MMRRAPLRPALLLALTLLLTAGLRLYGLDWDQGGLFHPDERAILMKVSELALPWPPDPARLLDPAASPLNPRWFPYGSFPLYLLKGVSALAALVNPALAVFPDLRLTARALAVAFDVGTVLLTFLVGARLFRREVGLLAAAFVALSVLHIQLSHFYAVDVVLTFLVMLTLYGAARAVTGGITAGTTLVMGIGLGLGLATKVSIAPLALAVGVAHLLPVLQGVASGTVPAKPQRMGPVRATGYLLATLALAAVVFTAAQPFALLDNPTFLRDVREQNEMVLRVRDYPYTRQYVDTPAYLYQLQQVAVWGLGLPLALAYLAGALAAVGRVLRSRSPADMLLLAWVIPYVAITGTFPVKFLRYMLPVLPVLAVLAAAYLTPRKQTSPRPAATGAPLWTERGGQRLFSPLLAGAGPGVRSVLTFAVLLATGWYALAYLNVYREPHPAVQASQWIRANLEPGTVLLKEHWEEGLPHLSQYQVRELRLYEDDNAAKVRHLSEELAAGDAVVFYSNRLYGTIPRLPERYPLSTQYYKLLFSGGLGYELAYVATAYPSFLGLTLVDDTFTRPGLEPPGGAVAPPTTALTLNFGYADESFTVYDHPKVMVFRKVRALPPEEIARVLTEGITLPAAGTGVASVPTASGLLLSAENRATQQAGGTWRELFDPRSFANTSPSLVWYLAVQALGLLALPLTVLLCRGLPDGGYAFAKLFGLLGMAYFAWLAAALKLAPFARETMLAGCALIALGSAWAVWRRRAVLTARLSEAGRVIAVEEVLFGAAFLGFYLVRLANPDLWHPYRGGEKPMDFAYLLAVIKSTTMPPYDPWFAGGYLNYYYYGQVIAGALIKFTGILPEVAYNLTVALFYALTATGAFSVAYNLTESARRALAVHGHAPSHRTTIAAGVGGAAGVALLGNLDGPAQLIEGLWKVSSIEVASPVPGVAGVVAAMVGLFRALTEGAAMPAFDFWRSSRMMAPTISITEFPFFTFLFADLHAHLLALPVTLLALGLAVTHALGSRGRGLAAECASLLALGWVLGALRWTNSWDFPTYFLFAGGALLAGEAQRSGRLRWPEAALAGAKGLAVYGTGALLFLPFAQTFEQFYAGIVPSPETTPVHQYLMINGIFLLPLAAFVALEALAAWGGLAAFRWARLFAAFWYESSRILRLRRLLARPAARPGAGMAVVALVPAALVAAAAMLAAGSALAGLLTPALLLMVVLIWRALRRVSAGGAALALALGMAALALAIAVGVEFITLQGDIQRMNTVFKFYLQTWVLLALAAAFGLWWVLTGAWQREQPGVSAVGTRRLAAAVAPWARPFAVAVALLAAGGLVYPLLATPARVADRFAPLPPTPDGLAYLSSAVYQDERGALTLAHDEAAIRWLREHVDGSPVIIEGTTPIYRWGGRVSVLTGLPTVLGWDWHQRQQRWGYQHMIDERLAAVNRLYSDPDPRAALDVIRTYGVQYIYVGELEQRYYPAAGLAKFEPMIGDTLEIAFRTPYVAIYRVIPGRT